MTVHMVSPSSTYRWPDLSALDSIRIMSGLLSVVKVRLIVGADSVLGVWLDVSTSYVSVSAPANALCTSARIFFTSSGTPYDAGRGDFSVAPSGALNVNASSATFGARSTLT